MLVNRSESINTQYYYFNLSRTPDHRQKQQRKISKLKNSSSKERTKLAAMLELNKKYQKEVIDTEVFKLKERQKYSPRKIQKMPSDHSMENILPLKHVKSSKQKESNNNLKKHNKSENSLLKDQNFTLLGQKFTQPKLKQTQNSLLQIPQSDISISKFVADSWLKDDSDSKTGYWISENKYVSLFPTSHRKVDKIVVVNQPQVLPILGSLTVQISQRKKQKYIVTDLNDNNSLRNLLNQFGALDQRTVKHYLRKIILCIWNLHKNKITHNRLSLDNIFYTENGEILVNMLKSSSKPLSQSQKFKKTYDFPPQLLFSKSNTNPEKNDIWAIGCIALQLLTNNQHKNNYYHPYNRTVSMDQNTVPANSSNRFRFLTSFQSSRMNTDTKPYMMKDSANILQKVQKMIESDINNTKESIVFIDLCQSIEMKEISPLAQDFVKKCLNLKANKRSNIDEIMFHPFLKS